MSFPYILFLLCLFYGVYNLTLDSQETIFHKNGCKNIEYGYCPQNLVTCKTYGTRFECICSATPEQICDHYIQKYIQCNIIAEDKSSPKYLTQILKDQLRDITISGNTHTAERCIHFLRIEDERFKAIEKLFADGD